MRVKLPSSHVNEKCNNYQLQDLNIKFFILFNFSLAPDAYLKQRNCHSIKKIVFKNNPLSKGKNGKVIGN